MNSSTRTFTFSTTVSANTTGVSEGCTLTGFERHRLASDRPNVVGAKAKTMGKNVAHSVPVQAACPG